MNFATLVVGDDVDEQLAPYDRNRSVRAYADALHPVEVEHIATALRRQRDCAKPIALSDVRDHLAASDSGEWILEDGQLLNVRTDNPRAKWARYVVGGRWSEFFPVHGRGRRARVRARDIDFARARRDAESKSRIEFAQWDRMCTQYGRPTSLESILQRWMGTRVGTFAETHRRFEAQPAIAAYMLATGRRKIRLASCPVAQFGFDEEAYVRRCRLHALVPFAMVCDGRWSDKETDDDWVEHVQQTYTSLGPDTQLTIVDCQS